MFAVKGRVVGTRSAGEYTDRKPRITIKFRVGDYSHETFDIRSEEFKLDDEVIITVAPLAPVLEDIAIAEVVDAAEQADEEREEKPKADI